MGMLSRLGSLLGIEKATASAPVPLSSLTGSLFAPGLSSEFDRLLATVKPMAISIVVDPKSLRELGRGGQYDPVTNTITLNALPDPSKREAFYEVMHVLVHELFHASMHVQLVANRQTASARDEWLTDQAVSLGEQKYLQTELDREWVAEETALRVIREVGGKDRSAPREIKKLDVKAELAEYQRDNRVIYKARFERAFGHYKTKRPAKAYTPGTTIIETPSLPRRPRLPPSAFDRLRNRTSLPPRIRPSWFGDDAAQRSRDTFNRTQQTLQQNRTAQNFLDHQRHMRQTPDLHHQNVQAQLQRSRTITERSTHGTLATNPHRSGGHGSPYTHGGSTGSSYNWRHDAVHAAAHGFGQHGLPTQSYTFHRGGGGYSGERFRGIFSPTPESRPFMIGYEPWTRKWDGATRVRDYSPYR